MTESKKAWVEPELLVPVRNKSEEAVLFLCKFSGDVNPSNAHEQYTGCAMVVSSSCAVCTTFSAS